MDLGKATRIAAGAASVAIAFTLIAWLLIARRSERDLEEPFETTPAATQVGPMAEWPTYASKDGGYTLRYPADWSVSVSNQSGTSTIRLFHTPEDTDELPQTFISVQSISNPANMSLEDWLQSQKPSEERPVKIEVGGRPAVDYPAAPPWGRYGHLVFAQDQQGRIYQITLVLLGSEPSEWPDLSRTFTQLINSFVFQK